MIFCRWLVASCASSHRTDDYRLSCVLGATFHKKDNPCRLEYHCSPWNRLDSEPNLFMYLAVCERTVHTPNSISIAWFWSEWLVFLHVPDILRENKAYHWVDSVRPLSGMFDNFALGKQSRFGWFAWQRFTIYLNPVIITVQPNERHFSCENIGECGFIINLAHFASTTSLYAHCNNHRAEPMKNHEK